MSDRLQDVPEPIPMFIVVEIETSGFSDTTAALMVLEDFIGKTEIPFEKTKCHMFIRESADEIREVVNRLLNSD